MKSFYASVECADRGLNPFETGLVVADVTRGKNALCLAVSPKLKAQGIPGRCRLSEIPKNIEYEAVPPRMQRYIDCAADIYSIYLEYFDPRDIHVYSVDESFIDATHYLPACGMTPRELAKKLVDEIAERLRIPSTAGIGTNLYLAKIALDITAKHSKDHMGYLDEELYRDTLWDHAPITDFWQIAGGTARRLARYGITTMREVAHADSELLYKIFGKDAELLIDHAWGRESCLISDIKGYKAKTHSVSFSQILPSDYDFDKARLVMQEMLLNGCQELMRRKVISRKVGVYIGYSHDLIPASHGSVRLMSSTSLYSLMSGPTLGLFDRLASRETPIRRLGVSFADVCDECGEGYDLFTDIEAVEREKARERAVLELADRYGKNAVLRGMNFLEGATQRERNEMIGGHRAGYDDEAGTGKAVHAVRCDEGPSGRPARA